MTKALIWAALFLSTALTDWLSARWADAGDADRRAWLSAIHEAVGFAAGFYVFVYAKDVWMAIPCVAGAFLGSKLADVTRPKEVDPAFEQTVRDVVELVLAEAAERSKPVAAESLK